MPGLPAILGASGSGAVNGVGTVTRTVSPALTAFRNTAIGSPVERPFTLSVLRK